MEKKTYPSGVITPELGSTNWYSDYDTNSSLLDSNITKTNSLDSKVKELETSYTNVETSLKSLSAVAKSGDYNDLSNKPESIALAEKAVADGDNNVITKTYATKKDVVTSLEPYIKKTELADVATSGSYTDLSDKPTTIAHADRSTADNNGDVITETYAKKTEIPNLDGYALSKDISKVGKTNNYKDLDNLPTIPSLDGYVTNVELSPVAKSGDYNDLSNTPEPVDLTPYATKSELGSKADDANVVHKSGNETIAGSKTFTNDTSTKIILQNTRMVNGQDDTVNRFWSISLTDKNNGESARILRFVNADNSSAFKFYEHYKGDSKNQVTMGPGHTQDGKGYVSWDAGIKNNTYPLTDNTYTLGTSTLKWKAVYANSVVVNDKNVLTDANQIMVLKNLTGNKITSGAVIDCGTGNGLLVGWYINTEGSWALATNKVTGKWKNVSIYNIENTRSAMFVKVG